VKQINNSKIHIRLFIAIISIYVVAIVLGGIVFYASQLAAESNLAQILIIIALIVLSAMVILFAKNAAWKIGKILDKKIEDNKLFRETIDAIPFPVHVTDSNMRWLFMNKAFEKLLKDQGVIKDRESAYGKACSNAGANICNTENCGIRQLNKGIGESYFDWCGMRCKQNTAYLMDDKGEKSGYVEVVTDLTSIIEVNDYNTAEISRVIKNLDKLASGDLDIDLSIKEADSYTEKAHDSFAMINKSLSKVKNALELMIGDAEMLVDSAVEGNLDMRADAGKHQGDYRKVIDGVNRTLDAIKAPLDVASKFIGRLSTGSANAPLENTYKGYYANLIDNLNNVRSALVILVDESRKLTQAGQNGELDVRGDADKLNGCYAEIINGMNSTFEAFAKPLDEAGILLGKMAVNDFTVQMSDGYKGRLKGLAVSIEKVHDNMLDVEKVMGEIGRGNLLSLDKLKTIGRRSENDRLMPATIAMMQAIHNLIESAGTMAANTVEGNLGVRTDENNFEGVYRQIVHGMNNTMEAFAAPIEEASKILGEFERGDLTVAMTGEYRGEYNKIKTSLNTAIAAINDIISNITTSANQVSTGSKQISDASQSLSQGSTEQACTVEELSSSISEIAAQTRQNASSAMQANEITSATKSEGALGNEKMTQLLDSMGKINESSKNISKIIKTIDDIAFQTNILALNAAVEAARAGQHGKGFAVVAEEVRNLAGKSAQAAKETTALIEDSIGKVESGTKIANETAGMLSKIVESAQKSAALVGNIAAASNEQATAITQIDTGISQVSNVVQTNSATAEECAASSEELSGQAIVLNQMVAKFKLSDTSRGADENASYESRHRNSRPGSNYNHSSGEQSDDEFGKY